MAGGVSPGGGDGFASPVFDSLRPWLQNLPPERPANPDELNALRDPPPLSGGGVPIRFVGTTAARARTFADQFEVRTFRRGELAVREASWHDCFNALAWLAFPRTKAAINRRHFAELERERVGQGLGEEDAFSPGATRSAARDALTLFDESGIIVATPCADLLELIQRHRWKALFWTRRAEARERIRFFVLGHAMHEKALRPYKGMTARAMLLDVEPSFLELPPDGQQHAVDEFAAARIGGPPGMASAGDLFPLPVMGIPGWSDNAAAAFYDDDRVFR